MPLFAPDAELAGTRALIVDDEDDVRELLEALLDTFGIAVIAASGGEEAFVRFRELRPDIVISDIQMPGGSGLELVRRIRMLPPEQGGLTPAIAMSGVTGVDEALDAGFHFHFTKPAPARALLDAIRSFVRDDERPDTAQHWTLGIDRNTLTIRWDGDINGADMRAMTTALVPMLEASGDGYRIISDLRRLKAFSPSVGAIAQLSMWNVRDKIRSVVVVGGSAMARAVSRSACAVLGIPCSLEN